MLIELILALVVGILIGTLTGLTPGIHINLVGASAVALSAFLLQFISPIGIVVFIVSMSIAHTFIDFIPSIFLGAPEQDTALSVLPGHEMLKQGRGYEAVLFTAYGCLFSVLIVIFFSAIFISYLPKIQPIIIFLTPYILIFSSLTIILTEKRGEKIAAAAIFLMSGFLGIGVLNSQVSEPLLPMLSGLFGASSLAISIKTRVEIPKQIITSPKIDKAFISPLIASFLTSPLCSFTPALGSGQAAVVASTIIKTTREKFLILLGATNLIVTALSFVVLYSIQKARTGVAISVQNLISGLSNQQILIILSLIILASIISFFLAKTIGKIFAENISKLSYSKLSIAILIFLSLIVFIFSGIFGFFIFIISTAVGIYGVLCGVKRINLMGCLLIPTILIYIA